MDCQFKPHHRHYRSESEAKIVKDCYKIPRLKIVKCGCGMWVLEDV